MKNSEAKMANQVYWHWIPLFSNLIFFFEKLGLKQLEISHKHSRDTRGLENSKLEPLWAFIGPKMVK